MKWVVEFLGGKEKLARFMQENKQKYKIFFYWVAGTVIEPLVRLKLVTYQYVILSNNNQLFLPQLGTPKPFKFIICKHAYAQGKSVWVDVG